MELIAQLAYGLAGIVLIIYSLRRIVYLRTLFRDGITTVGRIVGFKASGNAEGPDDYLPIVEFIHDDEVFKFISSIQKGIVKRYGLDEDVEVIFISAKLAKAVEIKNEKMLKLSVWINLISGCSILFSLILLSIIS